MKHDEWLVFRMEVYFCVFVWVLPGAYWKQIRWVMNFRPARQDPGKSGLTRFCMNVCFVFLLVLVWCILTTNKILWILDQLDRTLENQELPRFWMKVCFCICSGSGLVLIKICGFVQRNDALLGKCTNSYNETLKFDANE